MNGGEAQSLDGEDNLSNLGDPISLADSLKKVTEELGQGEVPEQSVESRLNETYRRYKDLEQTRKDVLEGRRVMELAEFDRLNDELGSVRGQLAELGEALREQGKDPNKILFANEQS